MQVTKVTQVTVVLMDAPGALAKMCERIAAFNINIDAIRSDRGSGVTHLVFNNTPAAVVALRNSGYDPVEVEVLCVDAANKPGTLLAMAKALGNAGINIEDLSIAETGEVILGADVLDKAEEVLAAL